MTATTLKLTKLEREILNHRLSIGDCIADVFEDDDHGHDRELVERLAGVLETAIDLEHVYLVESAQHGPVVAAILKEAIEGSTYWAAAEHSVSVQHLGRIASAGHSLAGKIGAMIDEPINFTTY